MTDDRGSVPARMDDGALLRVVEGPGEGPAVRTAAAKELVRRDPAGTAALLARLVRDGAAPADLRSVAAVALGRQPGAAHEAALTAALAAPEPLVVRRAAEGLGRIGGREALAALRRVPVPKEKAAARALSFARSLIAYRHGLAEELLSAPPPQRMTGAGEALSVEAASGTLKEEVRARLPREAPALPVRAEAAVRIACARNELLLLPAAEAGQAARSPAVAAVLMKQAHSLERFALHQYILSHPLGGGRVELFGVRPDGTLMLHGEGRSAEGGLRFEVGALATPYADPMRIEGVLREDGGIEVTNARMAAASRRSQPAPRLTSGPVLPQAAPRG
jgi:hypothetical protein